MRSSNSSNTARGLISLERVRISLPLLSSSSIRTLLLLLLDVVMCAIYFSLLHPLLLLDIVIFVDRFHQRSIFVQQ